MPTPPIIDKVRQLRDELGATTPKPETKPELDQLHKAVETVMLEPEHEAHYQSLGERLRAAVADLQIHHPALAGTMQQVLSALDAVGL